MDKCFLIYKDIFFSERFNKQGWSFVFDWDIGDSFKFFL